jgi:hypothetical protein
VGRSVALKISMRLLLIDREKSLKWTTEKLKLWNPKTAGFIISPMHQTSSSLSLCGHWAWRGLARLLGWFFCIFV